jgi:hypothetical protein
MWTLWKHFENFVGSLWELCGKSLRTLWGLFENKGVVYQSKGICIPYFTFIQFWILSLYFIIHCTSIVYYTTSYILSIVQYNTHGLYIAMESKTTWANNLLLYCLSASPLTMIMGQSFPWWEQCWEHWSEVYYLNVGFGLQNIFKHQRCLWTLLFPSNIV